MSSQPDNDSDGASICSDDSWRFECTQVGDSEEIEWYKEGGFHPVHLGDTFDNGRYRIAHKLGAGGFSTVWLARDTELARWVALKIVMAKKSEEVEEKAEICQKMLEGWRPNGRHLCLVLPVCGPSTYYLSHFLRSRIHPKLARSISLQTTKIVADLHARGLCHGDITPNNLVFSIQSLDYLNEIEVLEVFGEPLKDPMRTLSGEPTGPEAPLYMVGYSDLTASGEDVLQNQVASIDFDQAFHASNPPKELLGTPAGFLAPEAAVGQPPGPGSDVWALGCTILEARAGSSPFSTLDVDDPANLMRCLIEYLGDMPKIWAQPLFDDDGYPTADETIGRPLDRLSGDKNSLRDWISDIWDEPRDLGHVEYDPSSQEALDKENRPYPDCYKGRFWKPSAIKVGDTFLSAYCDEVDEIIESIPRISKEEVELLHDLMSKIFVYEPDERISAAEVMEHPWFRMDSDRQGLGDTDDDARPVKRARQE